MCSFIFWVEYFRGEKTKKKKKPHTKQRGSAEGQGGRGWARSAGGGGAGGGLRPERCPQVEPLPTSWAGEAQGKVQGTWGRGNQPPHLPEVRAAGTQLANGMSGAQSHQIRRTVRRREGAPGYSWFLERTLPQRQLPWGPA